MSVTPNQSARRMMVPRLPGSRMSSRAKYRLSSFHFMAVCCGIWHTANTPSGVD